MLGVVDWVNKGAVDLLEINTAMNFRAYIYARGKLIIYANRFYPQLSVGTMIVLSMGSSSIHEKQTQSTKLWKIAAFFLRNERHGKQ